MKEEIKKHLDGGFELALYEAALKNLDGNENPLRFNNFAYAFRELTRHILHRLAPDKEVIQCSWYVNETDQKNGVTRKQRAYYATQGGLSDEYISETLGLDAAEIHTELVRAITKLNKFTHIQEKTFGIPNKQVEELAEETLEAVHAFLALIRECRDSIIERVWETVNNEVIGETIRETLLAIDELATHHTVDAVHTEEVAITKITNDSLIFLGSGSIDCELQWGSNSDLRNGIGATLEENFPFSCQLSSPIDDPENISIGEESIMVDTSSWYGEEA
ncbi:MAG: hypothetical protein ABW077_08355 [Candidatus Thiodiazotropha endolucinida]